MIFQDPGLMYIYSETFQQIQYTRISTRPPYCESNINNMG